MHLNHAFKSLRLVIFLLGIAVVGTSCWQGQRPDDPVVIRTWDYAQAVVDAHPEGTIFFFEPGTHYNVHITPKNGQAFVGSERGAVTLNGSGSSEAAFNAQGHIQDVIVANLNITNYSPGPFDAVIDAKSQDWNSSSWAGPTNWVVSGVHLYGNYGSGESSAVEVGSGTVVQESTIENTGGLGIFGHGYDITIRDNVIRNNAYSVRDVFDHSGGIKLVIVHNSEVTDNEITGNNGVGIWFDINSDYNKITDNEVHNNTLAGIQYELSRGGTITGNNLSGNAWGDWRGWLLQSSIFISTSLNNVVENNTISDAPGGVTVVDQDYLRNLNGGIWAFPAFGRMLDNSGNPISWSTENNVVRNNTFTNAGNTGVSATEWESQGSNVYATTTFDNNTFNGSNSFWTGTGDGFANPVGQR